MLIFTTYFSEELHLRISGRLEHLSHNKYWVLSSVVPSALVNILLLIHNNRLLFQVGQTEPGYRTVKVNQLKQNTRLSWGLWVTLSIFNKSSFCCNDTWEDQRYSRSDWQTSNILWSNLLSVRNEEDLLNVHMYNVFLLFITMKDIKLHCVFNHNSITLSHLSLWPTTRFFSYKKRANPLSVFAIRARTSAMRVSVASGDFNLACKP